MKQIVSLCVIGLLFSFACKKDTASICENLAAQGEYNKNSIIGEWKFASFAYTANGKTNKTIDSIQKGYISVTDTGSVGVYHTNSMYYEYIIEHSNKIHFVLKESTYVNPPQEEIDVVHAFNNTVCYVVTDNTLLLHFTGNKDKNVIILTEK